LTSSVGRQPVYFVHHILEKSFRWLYNHHPGIHSFRVLQVPAELPTLENILDTFYNYSVCIKIHNWGAETHLELVIKKYDMKDITKKDTFGKLKLLLPFK
jgi:hypothetical protein